MFGDVRNVTFGSWVVDDPTHLGRVEREVGLAFTFDDGRPDDAGDLGVHLIGRLERGDGPPGSGVRQQDRLEHLVRPVGGEHHVGC